MIRDEDLRIEVWPPRAGGQQVGTANGIKIEHGPSGMTAICNTEWSQHRNKAVALDMLIGGLTSPPFQGEYSMTPEEIRRLRALCEAATRGPWVVERSDDGAGLWCVCHPETVCYSTTVANFFEGDKENADFIAAARSALPTALDEIERLALVNQVYANWAQRDRCNAADALARVTAERDALATALDSIEGECGCGMASGSAAINWPRVAKRAAGYAHDALSALSGSDGE